MTRIAWVLVLAACPGPREAPDAPAVDDAPIDGAATGECDAPATFADGITPERILYVAAGATGGDGSLATPFGTIEAAAAVATREPRFGSARESTQPINSSTGSTASCRRRSGSAASRASRSR